MCVCACVCVCVCVCVIKATWMRSHSCLLAISMRLKLFSTSLVLCDSFCMRLMYSTDALSMVPLFQRTSLHTHRTGRLDM